MEVDVRRWSGWGSAARVAAGLAIAVVLAGCEGGAKGVEKQAKGAVSEFFRAGAEEETIDPELIRPAYVCPQVEVQLGTEALRRGQGSGADEKLNYQASITNTARECRQTDAGMAVRVGVSGRVVEGAGGMPARVELPVRIAVREGSETTYSKLHKVTVNRTGASQSWAVVDEAIVVKEPAAAQIIVGFDGG